LLLLSGRGLLLLWRRGLLLLLLSRQGHPQRA
jgi:hypothetical protein